MSTKFTHCHLGHEADGGERNGRKERRGQCEKGRERIRWQRLTKGETEKRFSGWKKQREETERVERRERERDREGGTRERRDDRERDRVTRSPWWTTRIHPHVDGVYRAGVASMVGIFRGRLEGWGCYIRPARGGESSVRPREAYRLRRCGDCSRESPMEHGTTSSFANDTVP